MRKIGNVTLTNIGNVTLSNITVTDDQGVIPVYKSGDSDHDGKLDLNEAWVHETSGTAIDGAYANTGTATGKPPEGNDVSDDDVSQYFGYRLGIKIQIDVANLTQNGTFADLADLEEDDTARYRLIVTNTSNVALESVIVTDTEAKPGMIVTMQGGGKRTFAAGNGGVSEISLGTLAAGQSMTLTYEYLTLHSGIPRSLIFNTVTVTGHPGEALDPDGKMVQTDSDDAAINMDAIPLAVSSISIKKQVRNQTEAGILADMATGYANDIFSYVVTITHNGETMLSTLY